MEYHCQMNRKGIVHKMKAGRVSLTEVIVEDILYLVIALWKLEKSIVRKALSGVFRYFGEVQMRWKNEGKRIFNT